MKKSLKLNRRRFLSAVGATALTVPMMKLRPSIARADAPKRFIYFHSTGGTVRERWLPQGGEFDFTIPEGDILSPLNQMLSSSGSRVRDKCVILDGVHMTSFHTGPGSSHAKGTSHALTAMPMQEGTQFHHMSAGSFGWGGGISVDQVIGNRLADSDPTPRKSIELGVQLRSNSPHARPSSRGPGDQTNAPLENPYSAAIQLFGGGSMSGPDGAVFQALDHAQLLHGRMATRYTGDERERLHAHEAAIGDLRASLMTGGGACAAPDLAGEYGTVDPEANENVPVITRMQIDVMVAAMACNLTRVGTFVYQQEMIGRFQRLGISAKHHALTLRRQPFPNWLISIRTPVLSLCTCCRSSIRLRDGTMLDNTFVLWGNELGDGRYHRPREYPLCPSGRHRWIF